MIDILSLLIRAVARCTVHFAEGESACLDRLKVDLGIEKDLQ